MIDDLEKSPYGHPEHQSRVHRKAPEEMNAYLEFFELETDPFDPTPDPGRVLSTESHREALAILLHVIRNRKGFAAFYGEKGVGKTTLIRHVEQDADSNTRIIALSGGNISFHSLLKEILGKVGLPLERQSRGSMLHELYLYLIKSLSTGLNCVLILDDAHELHPEVLEDLRLLSNLETSRTKLIQIIFVGEPGLEEILAANTMRQLRQRIGIVHRMTPLTYDESISYIDYRARLLGKSADCLFTKGAVTLMATYAAGLHGTIDRLCHNAMVEGYIRNERPVTEAVVRAVRNEETFLTSEMPIVPVRRSGSFFNGLRHRRLKPALYALSAVLISALFVYAASLLTGSDLFWKRKPPREDMSAVSHSVPPSVEAEKPGIVERSGRNEERVSSPATGGSTEREASPAGEGFHFQGPYTRVAFESKKILTVPRDATLTTLAVAHYGYSSPMLLDLILEMNPDITDLDVILQGQRIRLPDITDATAILKFSEASYTIHLGTFTVQDKGMEYRHGLVLNGKNSEIVSRKVSGRKLWYRLLVGPYRTPEECRAALAILKVTK